CQIVANSTTDAYLGSFPCSANQEQFGIYSSVSMDLRSSEDENQIQTQQTTLQYQQYQMSFPSETVTDPSLGAQHSQIQPSSVASPSTASSNILFPSTWTSHDPLSLPLATQFVEDKED